MRKLLTLFVGSLLLSGSAASAQEALPSSLALPGSFWISAGDVGPAEPHNTIGQASLEQGLTVWQKGSWFLTPFVGLSLTADSRDYDWNNKHPTTVAIKLQKRTGNGAIHAGGGVMFERDPETGREQHPTAFAGYWTGWDRDTAGHAGGRLIALPGSASATSGLLTGRDPRNWLSYLNVQQGVVVYRLLGVATVPYGSMGVSFDTKGRPWENRATGDAGVKLVRAISGGVIEAGVAERFQRELKSGRRTSAPVVFVNMWIGWNPSTAAFR